MSNMIHLIAGDGTFNRKGMKSFTSLLKLDACGDSYDVVSIIGPQSSGKSTLLNHLFGTKFKEMNSELGRNQTTQGIWLAKAEDIVPFTLVIDVEGIDGIEREDNTLFERQSGLFALAVSDVVLVNMYSRDVGREKGGSLHFLRILLERTVSLGSPRKTTLLFVLRDKPKAPSDTLANDLTERIEKVYTSLLKGEDRMETPLSKYFDIEVVTLPNYEIQEKEFREQVASLRKRFIRSCAYGEVVRGRDIVSNMKSIWESIEDDEDLDMPTDKIMHATVRCDEINKEMYESFAADKGWRQVQEGLLSGAIVGFANILNPVIRTCLSQYNIKTFGCEEGVRMSKRQSLLEKILQCVHPAYESLLECLYFEALKGFQDAFEKALDNGESFPVVVEKCKGDSLRVFRKGCKEAVIEEALWDSSVIINRLEGAVGSYVSYVEARIAVERTVKSLEAAQAEEAATKEIASKAAAEARDAALVQAATHTAAAERAMNAKKDVELQIAIFQADADAVIAQTKAIEAEQIALAAQRATEAAASDKIICKGCVMGTLGVIVGYFLSKLSSP